jgi:hypothetical protein
MGGNLSILIFFKRGGEVIEWRRGSGQGVHVIMKDRREYIANSGGGKAGGTGILEECYMLGADTGVTIKTLIEEKVAIGAAWHAGPEGLELETMMLL